MGPGGISLECIYSFRSGTQHIETLNFPARPDSEEDAVRAMLQRLEPQDAVDLTKISVCQLVQDDDEEPLPWLLKRNGKFYFNTDVNMDEDTARWHCSRCRFLNSQGAA